MKLLLFALFIAAAGAAPLDASGDPVELIVNGVPEGQPLELSGIVDITVKEHAGGEVVAQSNLLHPLTAVGLAEAAVAAAAAAEAAVVEANLEIPAVVEANPETPAVVEASPEAPNVVEANPEIPAVVEASPEGPTVAETNPESVPVVEIAPITPVEMPAVVDAPDATQLESVSPVEAVEAEAIPNPAAQIQNPSGEVYNDGMVQVQVNYPEEEGLIGTLSSWLSVALNYIQNGISTTQQII